MSETSTLISCTGKITRTELAKLPTRADNPGDLRRGAEFADEGGGGG